MVIKRRIETSEAKALRSQRQEFAAPGGRHDRLIGFLARALPMGVGLVAALMVITPLSPRGEVSFLLDRKQVEVIDERLSVDNAMYRGLALISFPLSGCVVSAAARNRLWPNSRQFRPVTQPRDIGMGRAAARPVCGRMAGFDASG